MIKCIYANGNIKKYHEIINGEVLRDVNYVEIGEISKKYLKREYDGHIVSCDFVNKNPGEIINIGRNTYKVIEFKKKKCFNVDTAEIFMMPVFLFN